jgi:hypothetical protein
MHSQRMLCGIVRGGGAGKHGVHPKKRGKNADSPPSPVDGGNWCVENVVLCVATHPRSLVQCSVARKIHSRHWKWDAHGSTVIRYGLNPPLADQGMKGYLHQAMDIPFRQ